MERKLVSVGKCPECGKKVLQREGFYGCEGYKEGCGFTLGVHALASIGHAVITSKQMRQLLRGVATLSFRMSNSTERLFDVSLEKVDGTWRCKIDFDRGSVAPVFGSCPLCGADVIEYPLSFGCTRWEEGCEFAIYKNAIKRFGGKMLSSKQAKELLSKGSIRVTIRSFDGSFKEVSLHLDETYGCRVDFKGDEK